MEPYPLEALLTVREYREEGAKRQVRNVEEKLREAEQAVSDSSEHLSPDVRQRQESRARLEEFHERATMRAGEDEVTPVQERPRAHRVRRKK